MTTAYFSFFVVFIWLCATMQYGVNHIVFFIVSITSTFSFVAHILKSRLGRRNTELVLLCVAIHFILVLLYLLVEWHPMLQQVDIENGGDAQRYYYAVASPYWWLELRGKNYIGIYLYLKSVFWLGGHNVFSPAISNTVIFTCAVTCMTTTLYNISPNISMKHKLLVSNAIIFLNPSMVIYNAQSGKESITSSVFLITIAMLVVVICGKTYFLRKVNLILFLLALVLLKTWLILVHICSLSYFFMKKVLATLKVTTVQLGFTGLLIFCLAFLGIIQKLFGGYAQDLSFVLNIFDVSRSEAFLMHFDEHSGLSRALLPGNYIELFFYGIIRSGLYIIAPFPNVAIFFSLGGYPLTIIAVFIGGAINLILVVKLIIVSSKHQVIQFRFLKIILIFSIVAVGFSQVIIVERYRTFYEVLLVFLSVCAGASKRDVNS